MLTEVIKVRVSKKELAAIKEQAKINDMRLSAWIRKCLFIGYTMQEPVVQVSKPVISRPKFDPISEEMEVAAKRLPDYRRHVAPGALLKGKK